MADALLNTSKAAILSRINALISSSSASELQKNSQSAKNIGQDDDNTLEQSVASRVSTLASTATATELESMGRAIGFLLTIGSGTVAGEFIPVQLNNSGKWLKTDGNNDAWNYLSIGDLAEVYINALSNGDILSFDGASSKFLNRQNPNPIVSVTNKSDLPASGDNIGYVTTENKFYEKTGSVWRPLWGASSPTSISNLAAWYDIGEYSSYTGSGTTWNDISGNSVPSLTLRYNTSSGGGTYIASGVGGTPSFRSHDGSYYGSLAFGDFTHTFNSATTNTIIYIMKVGSDSQWRALHKNNNDFVQFNGTTSDPLRGGVYASGTSPTVYIDGVSKGTAPTSNDVNGDLFTNSTKQNQIHSFAFTNVSGTSGMISWNNFSTEAWKTQTAELKAILFYDKSLSNAEITTVHNYYKSLNPNDMV